MILKRPYIALITLILFVPFAFATTYCISVLLHLVTPLFPYISDTGTLPPTSCIFSQFLDIGAILLAFVTYVRYLHIKAAAKEKRIIRLNRICLALGFIAALGLNIVGNFQETNIFVVHMIGALMAFGCYITYLYIDIYITRNLSNYLYCRLWLLIFRFILCTTAAINLALVIIFTNIASPKFDGDDPLAWGPEDGGYAEHIVSTSNEWCLCFMVIISLTTFYYDFRNVQILSPQVVLLEHGTKIMDQETIKIEEHGITSTTRSPSFY